MSEREPRHHHRCGQELIVRVEYNRRAAQDAYCYYARDAQGRPQEVFFCPRCHVFIRPEQVEEESEVVA